MEIKVTLSLPSRNMRGILMYVVVPLALVSGVFGVAWATFDTTNIAAGKPINGKQIHDNFEDLDGRLTSLQNTLNDAPKMGFVGSLVFSGNTCNPVARFTDEIATTPMLEGSASCMIASKAGSISGASISPVGPTDKTLSFKLAGPAGHYMIAVSGNFVSQTGTGGTDRLYTEWCMIDGNGTSSGCAMSGEIEGTASNSTRYFYTGNLNAGFTYATPVDTTITFQVFLRSAYVANTTGAVESGKVPLEVRVYKM